MLLKICAAAELDPAAARTVLDRRAYREAVDRDWQRSRQLGITAVPTFVIDNQRLVGAQPTSALEALLLSAGVGPRKPPGK